jgi:hypothetical protein
MNELVVFDEVAATIAEWKAENKKLVFEYDTPQGEKDARSHIAKLRKGKTKVGEIHKEAKAEALAFGRKLDTKKNEYNGEIDTMIAVHKDPLDAIEAEKQAVIDAEKKRLEEAEGKRLLEIDARERAVLVAEEKIAREKAEAEQAEREKHIAEKAAETAAAFERQKARNEANAKELAEKKAKEEAQAKEQKRIANKKHRKQIEDEIHLALTETGHLDNIGASVIIEAIINKKIPHITINY